jgi:hypothetical protein
LALKHGTTEATFSFCQTMAKCRLANAQLLCGTVNRALVMQGMQHLPVFYFQSHKRVFMGQF